MSLCGYLKSMQLKLLCAEGLINTLTALETHFLVSFVLVK